MDTETVTLVGFYMVLGAMFVYAGIGAYFFYSLSQMLDDEKK